MSFQDQLKSAIKILHKEGPFSSSFSHIYAYGIVDLQYIFSIKKQLTDILDKKDTVLERDQKEISSFKTQPKPILLHIHSPGGLLDITISLVQYMKDYPIPIIGFIEGFAMSAAAILFRCCHYRVMGIYSHLLIHQLSLGFYGKKEELNFESLKTDYSMETILTLLDPPNEKLQKIWKDLLQRDLFLSSKKSLEYQLCDEIQSLQFWKQSKFMLKNTDKNEIPFMISNYNQYDKIPIEMDEIIASNPSLRQKLFYFDSYPFSNFVCLMNQQSKFYQYMPILLSFNSSEKSKLGMIQPMINIILSSEKSIIGLNTSILADYNVLSFIVCPFRIMYPYSYIVLNFIETKFGYEKPEDVKHNMKINQEWILNILKTFTKLPFNILKNIFKKQYLLKPNDCIKYGLCDFIYKS